MKNITKIIINKYQIDNIGYDFMGYKLQKNDMYTFHHLIIPRRKNGPETIENGAVLCGKTSHPYLHLIEAKEYEMFCYITSEMIDMNIKGFLDINNLKRIHETLLSFENIYCNQKSRKGKRLIKYDYFRRVDIKGE